MYRISICAHRARADTAHDLFDQAQATHMAMDNGTLGAEGNHRRCWDYHAKHATEDWAVVLEDDAVLCDNFSEQLEQVLTTAPTPVIGLYLGTATPPHWQYPIEQALNAAEAAGAHWLITHTIINAVAVAIRTDLLPLEMPYGKPIDETLAAWAKANNHRVGYVWPSIVEHRDEEPVIRKRADGGQRTDPRVAWRFGTREQWTGRSVDMMPQWANLP